MMIRAQILQGVQEIVGAETGIKTLSLLTSDTRLHHDLGAKTLCLLNVWCALEQHFGVSFSMVEGNRDALTIGHLAEAVAGKMSELQPSEVAA